mmetsp:Transcript_18246/g.61991  ORF Transcript_18246/g.61991 Transcript_18246/m.61991 type:complete len:91 (-) Transcript_18246:1494-1766(-)
MAGLALFEERFNVLCRDADGKKFERVSRFSCKSDGVTETDVELDVNTDLYGLSVRVLHYSPALIRSTCSEELTTSLNIYLFRWEIKSHSQ